MPTWQRLGVATGKGSAQLGGHIGDPSDDRGERAHAGQYRRRAQGENDRDRVIPALTRAPIGHTCEALQQVKTIEGGRRQIAAERIDRRRGVERCCVRISDDRMNEQRSSGGAEESVRGPLVLSELRSPTGATRRRSPNPCYLGHHNYPA